MPPPRSSKGVRKLRAKRSIYPQMPRIVRLSDREAASGACPWSCFAEFPLERSDGLSTTHGTDLADAPLSLDSSHPGVTILDRLESRRRHLSELGPLLRISKEKQCHVAPCAQVSLAPARSQPHRMV